MSQNQTQTTYIPKFAFPFKDVNNINTYNEKLSSTPKGNYLFTRHGLWHGAPHFYGTNFDSKIQVIADGELVAYRLNSKYLKNSDAQEGKGAYSTGFFLVRHKLEYPKDNKLTFFSLYMHTAKKDAYNIIQNQTNQSNTNYYTVKKGDTLGKIAKEHHTTVDKLRQDNNIADVNKIREGHVLIIKTNNHNSSSQTSQPTPLNSNSNSNPNFIVENPQFDKVVVLPTPIKIKAGEYLGLMGEYNVKENSQDKCLHLEVFASKEFKTFVQTAKQGDNKLPQSFNWATIIDEQSSTDHISIFENLELVFQNNPSEDLKMNEMFIELFNLIDKNHENGMEPQELKAATVNPIIKDITNNYIVKHSSEWDDKVNMVDVLLKVVNKIDDSEFENKDEYKKMLGIEAKRIINLSFFTQCKDIEGFPKDDKVYVMNAIGLVNQFNKGCLITKEMLIAMGCTEASNNQLLIDALNKYCKEYEINTCLRVAHFLAQAGHESGGFKIFVEDDTYKESIAMGCSSYATYRATPEGRNVQLTARKNRDGSTQKDAQGNVIYNCKQPEYFNCKYATKNGNGDFAGGDGHKYRGRGIIQLTGRNNYISYNTFHNTKNPNDTQDFVANPDLVKTNIEYTVESACWYWTEHGIVNSNINDVADRGFDDSVVLTVSKEVNGYGQAIPNGYNEPNKPLSRLPLFHKLKNYMGL